MQYERKKGTFRHNLPPLPSPNPPDRHPSLVHWNLYRPREGFGHPRSFTYGVSGLRLPLRDHIHLAVLHHRVRDKGPDMSDQLEEDNPAQATSATLREQAV